MVKVLTEIIVEALILWFCVLLAERYVLLCHWIVWIRSFIRINKLIEFNVALEWHLLSLIKWTWWLLEVEEWSKLFILTLIWVVLVLSIYLESSVSWTFSSLSHRWIDLFLLHRIDLLIDCILVLLLLVLRIEILLLLLLAQLPSMFQLICTDSYVNVVIHHDR